MQYSQYIGHASQVAGVEECRLAGGGKGDGMRLWSVRNGLGLDVDIVPDRCADVARLSFMGRNMGYFSPCGYVAPAYYDKEGSNFLKSFTAGFLTTCGLRAVGQPCVDEGETLPLHGSIANIPAEHIYWRREADALYIEADICEGEIFASKLSLHRRYRFSLTENRLQIEDCVENHADRPSPLMLLYHINMGYPLLSENARIHIPSRKVTPRDAHAATGLDKHLQMPAPQAGFQEQCYYHSFEGRGRAAIYNPDIGLGLCIGFDTAQLPYFCQWKMAGVHDYVLGLEPGNCTPDGRAALRARGELDFIEPGESRCFAVEISFAQGEEAFHKLLD